MYAYTVLPVSLYTYTTFSSTFTYCSIYTWSSLVLSRYKSLLHIVSSQVYVSDANGVPRTSHITTPPLSVRIILQLELDQS